MKILIIGAGNMGLTFGASFINASVLSREDLYFLDRKEDKQALIEAYSQHPILIEPSTEITDMDLVILAVKPQDFASLAAKLRPYLREDQLVLSIMAGLSLKKIGELLGLKKIVRAMPNLPAQVAQGMTVFSSSSEVTRIESYTVQNLLNTTGKAIYAEEESMIDAATAISGSGPAYVFYFMNAMILTAKSMGFSDSEAQLLVRQTFMGGLTLLNRDHIDCDEWIRRVSSRGGTTEAALKVFDAQNVQALIEKGLQAARQRAVELSEA